MGTASGIGGGLASVITPAKVQNAAATIDEIGIEGQVIAKTIGIATFMLCFLAGITLLWSRNFPTIDLQLITWITLGFFIVLIITFISGFLLNMRRKADDK